VYIDGGKFRWVKAPTRVELTQLAHTIAQRVGRFLERQGLLERDAENSYLASDAVDEDPMTQLLGHSITYRIAVGPQQDRQVFTLQTLPACDPEDQFGDMPGLVAGFSLHAGVAAKAQQRNKLERLCRYDVQGSTSVAGGRKPGATISRPAISEKRLSLTSGGKVRYELKTPYQEGTTHVIFEPLDFTALAHPCARGISASLHVIARLAALVPRPRVNLTIFHGVFAPNSKHRALVTPAKRGKVKKAKALDDRQTPAEQRSSMTWAQRLKRVFTCGECGGAVKVIACIEDPVVIKKILTHLKEKTVSESAGLLPESRASPQAELFG